MDYGIGRNVKTRNKAFLLDKPCSHNQYSNDDLGVPRETTVSQQSTLTRGNATQNTFSGQKLRRLEVLWVNDLTRILTHKSLHKVSLSVHTNRLQ